MEYFGFGLGSLDDLHTGVLLFWVKVFTLVCFGDQKSILDGFALIVVLGSSGTQTGNFEGGLVQFFLSHYRRCYWVWPVLFKSVFLLCGVILH